MDKLSVVIITYNEERNIERAILSVKELADEIIVVDSYSTDVTPEICKQHKVVFYQQKWLGYSEQKNFANSLATHAYIFSLDADEAVGKELSAEIIAFKNSGFTAIYTVNRLTNYCGEWIKHSGWYPDKKIRIFPKQTTKWVGVVHEVLEFEKEYKEIRLKNDLKHYSYYSANEHQKRADKYSQLTAIKMHEKGKEFYFFSPYLSAIACFLSMYVFKLGFLDGKAGFKIAQISASSNVFKYKELGRLNRENI